MTRLYEKKISCKNQGPEGNTCGIEIGLFENKWYDTNSDIIHSKTCKFPRQFKRRSNYPKEEMAGDAVTAEIAELKDKLESVSETLGEHDRKIDNILEILKAHTAELDFKKGNTVE
jgi:hypothetical protein